MIVKKMASQPGYSCHNAAEAFAKGLVKMDKFEEWLVSEIEQIEAMVAHFNGLMPRDVVPVTMLNSESAVLQDVLDKYRELKQPVRDDLAGLAAREV